MNISKAMFEGLDARVIIVGVIAMIALYSYPNNSERQYCRRDRDGRVIFLSKL